jgi:hypothetical protein
MVSKHYGYNTSCMVLFSKTYDADMLRCPYKNYNSRNMWQANRDLLSANFFSITTHRQKGKKISILPPGDVNPRPVTSRWCLLEDSPYQAVGAACPLCDESRPRLGHGDIRMYCDHLRKMWIRSYNVCNVVHAALNAWVPHGEYVVIYLIYLLCSSAVMLTTFA